jgi:methylmalonyl-CoA/ethylmalonyl-CoA epimerase
VIGIPNLVYQNVKKQLGGLKVKSILNIKEFKLDQLGFVVRDADKSMKLMWETFGIGPWTVVPMASNMITEAKYRGKPGHFAMKIAFIQNKLGQVEIELIEPLEGDNIYSDFLREHGDGLHHLGSYKPDTLKAFHEDVETLETAGFPCLMSGLFPDGAFAYMDTTRVLNTILELYWHDDTKSFPPTYVFP